MGDKKSDKRELNILFIINLGENVTKLFSKIYETKFGKGYIYMYVCVCVCVCVCARNLRPEQYCIVDYGTAHETLHLI